MLFNRDSSTQKCFQKILHSLQVRKSGSLSTVRTTCRTIRTPILSKASSIWTTWIPVQTFLCVEKLWTAPTCIRMDDSAACPDDTQCSTKVSGFLSKTLIWEDRCHRPDDVHFRPDTIIHKASIAIQIQTSGRQLSWSGRASIRYGNCVHQISCLDDHPPSPDVQSLYMEITCSKSATVRMTRDHRPNTAHFRKDFQRNF
jgi:hypothetical protein